MNDGKDDAIKIKPYKRDGKYGVKKRMKHECMEEHSVLQGVIDDLDKRVAYILLDPDLVQRDGKRVVKVTKAQKMAYDTLYGVCKEKGHVSIEDAIKFGVRAATLKVLVRLQLVRVEYDDIVLAYRTESHQEILSKGGVGKIVIIMGV